MAEYIKREDVLRAYEEEQRRPGPYRFETLIESVPSADVAPVRHGRWAEYENEADNGFHYCSECKHQAVNYDEGNCTVEVMSDYCPNCGAKMDGGAG